MLKPPYKFYENLHIYSINSNELKINDRDLIGIWKDSGTSLIFFHKNKDNLMKGLAEKFKFKILYYTVIPYSDWESGKFIKKFKIEDWEIVPEWEKEKIENKDKAIIIDPSVAFGSGFHPTTRMILKCFYKFYKNNRNLSSCIDLGCGTGILSIFAGKLGIKNVIAVDNNNLAYEVTLKNVKINNLEKNIRVKFCDIFNLFPINYDVVFANLYYNLLEKLFKFKKFWCSKYYFFSGFIKSMANRIIKNLPDNFEILDKDYCEDWCMIFVKRRD